MEEIAASLGTVNAKRGASDWRKLDQRDVQFAQAVSDHHRMPIDRERYAGLFRWAGDRLTGDVTPGYSMLPDSVVDGVVARFPRIRVLLLLRHPVDRVVSQAAMDIRMGRLSESVLSDAAAFEKYVLTDNVARRSFGTKVAARWRDRLPPRQFRHFFLDDIVLHPAETRADILDFLGGEPSRQSGHLAPDFNRKSNKWRVVLSHAALSFLVSHLAPELDAGATMFGGAAEGWATRPSGSQKSSDHGGLEAPGNAADRNRQQRKPGRRADRAQRRAARWSEDATF